VVTRSRFVDPPLSSGQAAQIAKTLYQSRRLSKIYPSRGTVIRAIREGGSLGISGPVWYDLFLAMTMQEAGVGTIVTENASDFRHMRFISTCKIQDAVKSFAQSS